MNPLIINLTAAIVVVAATAFVLVVVVAVNRALDDRATRRRVRHRLYAFHDQAHPGARR